MVYQSELPQIPTMAIHQSVSEVKAPFPATPEESSVDTTDVDSDSLEGSTFASERSMDSVKSCLKREDSSSTRNKSAMKRSVSFDSIIINEFDYVLGDNPSATGVPVSLSRTPHSVEKFQLDNYEKSKPAPRDRDAIYLSPAQRKTIVKEKASTEQINNKMREMRQIKLLRSISVDNMSNDEWAFKMEMMERKIKSVLTLKFLKKRKSSRSL